MMLLGHLQYNKGIKQIKAINLMQTYDRKIRQKDYS